MRYKNMNTQDLITYLLTPVGQVALVMGLAEVIKRLGLVNIKYIPIIDICLGVISGAIVYGYTLKLGYVNGVMVGLAIGLSACGLFSGIKNVVENGKGK